MSVSGKIIVIEGIDGSGKATQTEILVDRLTQTGQSVETLDFPQYQRNFFGVMVRSYLDGKFGDPTKVDPHLASLLYAADRWESIATLKQWMSEGKTIILDRYYTSNLVHQAAKIPKDKLDDYIVWLDRLEFEVFKIPRHEIVIFLHVSPQVAFDLIQQRGQGRDGHDTIEHLELAEKRCQYMAEKLGWIKIDCFQNEQLLPKEVIAEKIWQAVNKII